MKLGPVTAARVNRTLFVNFPRRSYMLWIDGRGIHKRVGRRVA